MVSQSDMDVSLFFILMTIVSCMFSMSLRCVLVELGSEWHKHVRPMAPAGTRGRGHHVRNCPSNCPKSGKVYNSTRLVWFDHASVCITGGILGCLLIIYTFVRINVSLWYGICVGNTVENSSVSLIRACMGPGCSLSCLFLPCPFTS